MQEGQRKKPTGKIGQYILSSADSKNSPYGLLLLSITHSLSFDVASIFHLLSGSLATGAEEEAGSQSHLPPPAFASLPWVKGKSILPLLAPHLPGSSRLGQCLAQA